MLKIIGILSIGIFGIIWSLIKLVSCVMIAGYISNYLGLDNYYWWFSSIILFSILVKLVFHGNSNEFYENLVDDYKENLK